MTERETTTFTCPRWDPNQLADDIAEYVERCQSRGLTPDSFAFALTHSPRHDRVPGRKIDELLTKEMTRYGKRY